MSSRRHKATRHSKTEPGSSARDQRGFTGQRKHIREGRHDNPKVPVEGIARLAARLLGGAPLIDRRHPDPRTEVYEDRSEVEGPDYRVARIQREPVGLNSSLLCLQ